MKPVLGLIASGEAAQRRLRGFVGGALAIALLGLAIRLVGLADEGMVAGLLRFYWFRLADVAVPLGVTMAVADWAARRRTPAATTALVLLTAFHLADCAVLRVFSGPPFDERVPHADGWLSAGRWLIGRGERPLFPRQPRADRLPDYAAWREACQWVAASGRIPPTARFLTPRMSQTFKWYARRPEVAVWKETPQDAAGLVQWRQRIDRLYATGNDWPLERWFESLADLGPEQLQRLGAEYQADYCITNVSEPLLPLPVVYRNKSYVIYRLDSRP